MVLRKGISWLNSQWHNYNVKLALRTLYEFFDLSHPYGDNICQRSDNMHQPARIVFSMFYYLFGF